MKKLLIGLLVVTGFFLQAFICADITQAMVDDTKIIQTLSVQRPVLNPFFSLEVEDETLGKASLIAMAAGVAGVGVFALFPEETARAIHKTFDCLEPVWYPLFVITCFGLAARIVGGVLYGEGVEWLCYDAFKHYNSFLKKLAVHTELVNVLNAADVEVYAHSYFSGYAYPLRAMHDCLQNMLSDLGGARAKINKLAVVLRQQSLDVQKRTELMPFIAAVNTLQNNFAYIDTVLALEAKCKQIKESPSYLKELETAQVKNAERRNEIENKRANAEVSRETREWTKLVGNVVNSVTRN